MNKPLKLDFNERSDRVNPLTEKFSYGETLWQYPDREPLERLIAKQNQLLPTQVLCTNGGDEAIMILMRMIKENYQMILPLPAFSQYTWGVKSWQQDALVIPPRENLAIDVEATIAQVKRTKNSVTIITRPNNPTGEAIANADLIAILQAAQTTNSWVFLDEAYIEFAEFDSVVATLLPEYNNLVILRTFSKAYGLAGIRLGYILGRESLIEAFRVRCMPFNIATPSLQVAEQALLDDNQKEMRDYCDLIKKNRQVLSEWLIQNKITVFPSQANFVLIKLPTKMAAAVKAFMAKQGILIRTFTEEELVDCIRISIPTNLKRLIKALQQCLVPELICFDMDGVLIDTSGSYDQSVLATVKALSGRNISVDDIESLRRQGGFNNDWVLSRQLLLNLDVDVSLEKVTDVFQTIYLGENNDGLVNNETPLINQSFVSKINQSNKNFTIVTGRPKKEALAGQAFVNLSSLELISLDDVQQGKPSPEGIQKLQQKYSELSWMCGDNPDDMQAAVASGSFAIGIGSNKVEALYQAGADIVLDNINELEKWLCR
ncbi:MAG: aminotransferase class I/II-fold pyridoxal phosphate-dependent enzyme [Kangiellaceae bacterium]